jgi:DNA-binding CsgD family transcriptional regulator
VRIAVTALASTQQSDRSNAELRQTLIAFVSGCSLARLILDGPRALDWHQKFLAAFEPERLEMGDSDVVGLGVPRLAINGRDGNEKRPAPRSARPPLSSREREVLGGIVSGMTTAEIAYRLGVKTTTIATLVARIFNKLGVNNRASAVALALTYGLCGGGEELLT